MSAPEWLVQPVPKSEPGKGFSRGAKAWLKDQRHGQLSNAMREAVDAIPTGDFGHSDMVALQAKLVGLATEGHAGVEYGLQVLRKEWLRGDYDTSSNVADFERALEDRIRTHGAAKYTTFPQTKAERKVAKKRRGKESKGKKAAKPGSLYVDIAAALEGGLEAPVPDAGSRREDGWNLLYSRAVNVLFGPPESGKSLIAAAMAADTLKEGGSVLWLDLDHNGVAAILSRLTDFGVPLARLTDPSRFRLAMPEDSAAYDAIVADARKHPATLVIVDSVGEVIPLYGGNTNDADDYTAIHRRAFTSFAMTGAAVLVIDHEAKGSDSRAYGATGTVAKKRAVDGVMLRVSVMEPFAPGQGGAASLFIVKDRHGGLRKVVNTGGSEPLAAVFSLTGSESGSSWKFNVGRSAAMKLDDDVATLATLNPRPTSKEKVIAAMNAAGQKWGSDRAYRALRGLREQFPDLKPFEPATNNRK